MNADPTCLSATFGMHIDMVEMCDLKKRVDLTTRDEVEAMKVRIHDFFWFPEPGVDAIAGPVAPRRWIGRRVSPAVLNGWWPTLVSMGWPITIAASTATSTKP